MLHKKPSFYLSIAGLAGTLALINTTRHVPPPPPPLVEPARSPYTNTVAATGIIEAARENVKVAVPKPGLVHKVFVKVGSVVKAGEPMLELDNREAKAKIETMKSQLAAMKAALEVDKVQRADWQDQLERVVRLEKDKVATEEERRRKEFGVQNIVARLDKAQADIAASGRQLEQAQVELDVLTVRAPRDGTILQVNIREGEFAGGAGGEPLLVLGDVDKLQVRADVDEQNAPMVSPNQPATAHLKGTTQNPIPLRFVRIEPYVIPKRSLTGDSAERVDTRVLQIIFELDRPDFPVYVGQQVDVFIKREGSAALRQAAAKAN